ncbi:chromatin binding protein [Tulasnella sp. 424]|nr:chromatin binding protein [Tulasnella sp. 424]KAG8965912.1 chromatin binding protein [Tulasnella sp. 425]
MNVELLNPFGQNFPENVVATLEDAALCLRYSPTGRFIAAGRYDGFISVWDTETKGIIRSMEGHVKGIVSVSWSRNSKYILTASKDWNCIIWDLKLGERTQTIRFDTPLVGASFHPRNSKIILVTLATQQCFICDLRKKRNGRVELSDAPIANGTNHDGESKASVKGTITVARFSADGKTVWLGTSSGALLIFHTRTKELISREKLINNYSIKHMEFDRAGNYLVLNSTERIVRAYSIDPDSEDKPTLTLLHKLQDPIQRSPWMGVSFSGDGEYVLAGSGNIASHGLYIWDRTTGDLEKILEGPKEPLTDLHWHPIKPHIASLAQSGLIHLWGRHVTENYSAFAPGFEELDENIEYEEREDEFDIPDEEEEQRRRQRVEEEEVDVDTVEPPEEKITKGRLVSVLAAPGQGDEEDAWADEDPDDDVEFDWFPPVMMEEDGDEEDGEF